jgi:HEAT repeat protein
MGLFGPPDVEKMKEKKNIKGLIKALNYKKDWSIRADAAGALGDIGDVRAVEPLIAALKHGEREVRQAITEALGKIGNPQAVEPLIATLKDKEWKVRKASASALGKIGDQRAVEPLIIILKNKLENEDVLKTAAAVLGKIGDYRAVEPLIAVLKGEVRGDRQAIAEALGEIGDTRAVEPLIATLKDEGWPVRECAAKVLDKLGWKPDQGVNGVWYLIAKKDWEKASALGTVAVEALITALEDEDGAVGNSAAKALGKIADPRAVEPLISKLKDEKWSEHKAIVEALGVIGKPAVEPLIAALEDEKEKVRTSAAEALGEIGDPRAVEPLIATLMDKTISFKVGRAALWSDYDYSVIVRNRVSYVRWHAAVTLAKMYHNGTLDEVSKKHILAVREVINKAHSDQHAPCGMQLQSYRMPSELQL